MTIVTISRCGKSLGVRLPRSVVRSAYLKAGDSVTVSLRNGEIVLRPARVKFDVNALIARITPENRHAAVDFGPECGQ